MKQLIAAIKTILLLLAWLVITTPASANDHEPPDGGDTSNVPIDGGLSILLAAGVAYGAKKGYDMRKKNREQ